MVSASRLKEDVHSGRTLDSFYMNGIVSNTRRIVCIILLEKTRFTIYLQWEICVMQVRRPPFYSIQYKEIAIGKWKCQHELGPCAVFIALGHKKRL